MGNENFDACGVIGEGATNVRVSDQSINMNKDNKALFLWAFSIPSIYDLEQVVIMNSWTCRYTRINQFQIYARRYSTQKT
jgi:hypothetical protein